MRYEDSSQAGAVSSQSDGQAPEARDDVDTIAAGAREPVTGNVISGEGTQFGAASSDLSAEDASVTAVAGAGGKDSSFSGGKLAVTGEYGKLSIDAEGNYSYLANKGAPENSRDTFTYTLADKEGNSDTAALIIEIGKTPVVIQANAQQVVVGPDGVVVLPAGVQLTDITVVGRNLVVTLPDGSQMVIIDGAVFVPQLVLGGVEVPATNLAALFVTQEIPNPAFGANQPPPSGGGTFGLPPGPLDPGVPLGDLLPPTEMVYTPPEVREVNGILDREPEIFIDPGNGVPVEAAVDSVNEAGLPARNEGEPEGSGEEAAAGANGDPSEATTGTIVYTSPDTPNVITINGIVVTGALNQVIPGDFGNLVLTSFGDGTIGYTYTLFDNTSGNTTHDDFEVILTDVDGDSDTATLVINIVDDVPTARPDTDSIAAGQYGPATGNVITDAAAGDADDSDTNARDTVGADDASLTSVSGAGGSDSTFNEGGNLVVNGQYGVLTIDADGNYSYVRNQGTPGGVTDVFNYTLTDGDGDTSSSTLTISIGDATPETRPNPTALLDDDALANGNPGGVGDDPDSANLSGNLTGVGGDGPLAFAVQLTGAPAGFTYVSGGAGVVLIQQGGVTVLTVTVNASTGAYTVVQNAPIDHPAGLDENNVSFTVNYTVTDQDGDSAPGTIDINVDDDTPTIGRADVSLPTLTVDETNLALNDSDGFASLFQTSFGADGAGSVSYALSVVNGTDSGLIDVGTGLPVLLYNIGGVVTGSTSANLAGVTAGNTVFTASIDANTGVVTLDQVRALDHPQNPNPNDPVSPNATSIQAVATVTDGDGDPVSLAVNIGSSFVFLDDGPSVDITLSAAAEPVLLTQDTETDGTPTTQDSASASFAANFTVNVNNGADGPGTQSVTYALGIAAPGADSGLNQGGADIFLHLIGGVVVGSTSASAAGVNAGNTVFNVTVDAAGSVTLTQFSQIDHPIGSDPTATGSPFADHVLSLTDNLVTLTATANVTDGDGDPASDSQLLNIGANLQFADDGPDISAVLTGTLLKLDETDGVGVPGEVDIVGGNLGTITVAAASLFTVSNGNISADVPTTLGYALVLSADGVASGLLLSTTNAPIFLYNIGGTITGSTSASLAGVNAGNTAFTVSVNAGTGAVTMTQFLAVEHSNTASNDEDSSGLTPGVLSVRVTATDFDGDTDQASVDLGSIIRFEDDGPTIDVGVNGQVSEPVLLTQDTETDGTPTTQDTASSAINFGGVFTLGFTTGSDGAATPTLSYALGLTTSVSGLTQGGAAINLYLIGGVVVGSTSATLAGVNAGNTVFDVTVSATGVVTQTQYSQIDHPIGGDPSATGSPFADHIASLPDGAVTLTASSTITDNDGDPASDSATVNIGANLQFADDGPDVAAVLTGTLLKLDETDGVGVPGEVDPAGGNLGTITVAGATLVSVTQPNVSADTPTALAYSLVLSVDGVASGLLVSSNNAPIFLYNIGGTITGSTSATLAGVNAGNTAFTVSVNAGTGAVTMTQFLAVEHPTPGASHDEDSSGLAAGALSLRVTATDFDGDTDQASVDLGSVIRFEDDGPSATNDVDVIVGGNGPATGNVLTGVEVAVGEDANNQDGVADNVGSDTPGTVTFIASNNVPANTDGTYTAGNLVVSGQYGVLTINANGDYSYLRNDGTPGGVNDVFTYTLTDADGDTVTATLTIGIDDNFPTAGDVNVQLDDETLAGGIAGGTGDVDPNLVNASGNLPGAGGDGAKVWSLLTTGAPAGFSYVPVGNTIQVFQGATHVVTISITNTATGAYTVTQIAPIDHPDGLNENNVQFTVNYRVTDADGDFANGTIDVDIDDDSPTINVTQTNEGSVLLTTQDAETDGVPTNEDTAASTANFSGVFGLNQAAGADGAAVATLSYALAVTNAASGLNAHGVAINLYLIGDVVVGSTSVNLAGVNAGNTIFNIAVSAGGVVTLTQFSQVDHPIAGDPTATGAPFDDHIISLVNGRVTLTASSTITDGDNDTATDQEVIDLGGNIRFADDGPIATNDVVNQVTENSPITFGVFGNDQFGADGVDTDNNPTVNVTFTQPPVGQGTVSYNAATGQFTFTPAAGQEGSTQFTYTLIDFDGDTSTATVTINLQPDSTPSAVDGVAAVDDDALAGGNAASVTGDLNANTGEAPVVNPSEAIWHGQLAATAGGDTIVDYDFASMHGTNGSVGTETVVYSWVNGTSTLTATTVGGTRPGTVLFDVVINQATGEYNLTLRDNILHANVANENDATTNLTFTVTDSDGDTDTGLVVVTFDDDAPTIGTIENGTASNNPADVTSTGELNLVVGADSPAVVTAITATNVGVITSGGFNLVTNVVGNVLTAYQDVGGNGTYDALTDVTAVYTLTVNPAAGADGEWVFNLITPLDPTVTDVPIGGSASFGAGPTGFQILTGGVGPQDLSVISGYLVDQSAVGVDGDGTFNAATWLSTGVLVAGDIASAGINGSTAGWGVDNNGFEDPNELMVFDFGSQASLDPDAGGPYVPPVNGPEVVGDPPEVQMPNVSFATFEFINYTSGAGNAGDDIAYVVHYTNGTFTSGFIPAANIDGALWTHTAPAGLFIADIQFYSGLEPDLTTSQDLPPGKIDLVSVGVQDTDLDETINFNVTITDADGDAVSGGFSVNIADGNTPSLAAAPLAAAKSTTQVMREAANDGASLSSNDTQKFGSIGNTGIVAGALAAAGMMAMPVAAEPIDLGTNLYDPLSLSADGLGQQMVDRFAIDDLANDNLDLGGGLDGAAFDAIDIASQSHGFDDVNLSDLGLTDLPVGGDVQDLAPALAVEQGPAFDFAAIAAFAPAIGMPAAEQLVAAGLTGDAIQRGGSVEQVLADALGSGAAATVDALLQGLPGQEFGGNAGFDSLATPIADHVPAWDMGMAGAFVPGADMMFKMDAAMLHHDAVQPVVNG